jgi:hypothetical protein
VTERIFLTYTNATAVPYIGSPMARHVVINYIDSTGQRHTLQGLPERKFEHNMEKVRAFYAEEGRSTGIDNTDSPFGRLRGHPSQSSETVVSEPHTVVTEGNNLRAQWNRMLDFSNRVNSIGYEYRPYSQNSNSFAAGALKHAGLLGPGTASPELSDRLMVVDPTTGESNSFSVPGFDQSLKNPINEFKNRFGDWNISRSGSSPRDPGRPSVFDTSAPAVPFVPSSRSPPLPRRRCRSTIVLGVGRPLRLALKAARTSRRPHRNPLVRRRLIPKRFAICAVSIPTTLTASLNHLFRARCCNRTDRSASSAASRCRTIPFRRCCLVFQIDPPHLATTWTTGSTAGSSR